MDEGSSAAGPTPDPRRLTRSPLVVGAQALVFPRNQRTHRATKKLSQQQTPSALCANMLMTRHDLTSTYMLYSIFYILYSMFYIL